ncbi:MAG: hypothetical protein HQ594_02200, partial [Candidatus Omnitrophica bacterium]|nr:hypothetical protein [Candidatus Omnitrophota bacterium]
MTTFEFTANNLNRRERRKQRIFEIIPGLTSWSILIGMAVMAFTCPLAAAVIIIAFYLYWLLRLLYMMLFLVFSYARLKAEEKSDWMARIRGINDIDRSIDAVKKLSSHKDRGEKASLLFFRKQLEELRRKGGSIPLVEDIYHLVIIPVAKETKDIVEPGVRSLAGSIFPPEKILVVMALEERASAEVSEGVAQLKKVYGDKFMDMLVAVHPDGIVGEARGKGANATFAAKKAAEYFKEKKIPLENITSSCFDSDTVINPDYFASLTYYFLTCPKRQRASFQPVPVYNNNIWEAPGITRVLEIGSSFYQLIEATNPEKLVTFSSHSMSFKALVEVGYWPVDM